MRTIITTVLAFLATMSYGGEKGFIITQVHSWDAAVPNDPTAPHFIGSEVNYVGIDKDGVLFRTAFISIYPKDRLFHSVELFYPGGKRSHVNHVDKMYSVEYDLPVDPLQNAAANNHCFGPRPPTAGPIKFLGYEDVLGIKAARVTFGKRGDVWYWEEGGCLSLKEQGGNGKLESVSIVRTDDAAMFTAIPSDFMLATERRMADVRFKRVYGDDYMSKITACQKRIFNGPDPHGKFAEPKAIRDSKGKAEEETQQKK
jgi:hypothetical protein